MKDYITILLEAIMNCFKKHGFLATSLLIIGLLIFASVLIFIWQLPDIITAIKS